MSHPDTMHENHERHFAIRLMPCLITKQFDKVICVKLAETQPVDEHGEPIGKALEVYGQFSETGLRSLLRDLEEAPDPVGLPTPDEIRRRNPYQWGVVMDDGSQRLQYNDDETENRFAEVHLPNVRAFWILPRTGHESLPRYGLIPGVGFVRGSDTRSGVLAELPYPDWPFHWQYYRRNWITHSSFGGGIDLLPERVVQVLGWRIRDEDRDVILEIGIEADGNWTIFRKEPLGHPGFDPPQSRQIVAQNGVRIVDLIEGTPS